MLQSDIRQFSAAALNAMADHLEAIAKTYRRQAQRIDDLTAGRERNRQTLARAAASPRIVAEHLAAGRNLEHAQSATAIETNLPIETIAYYWQQHLKASKRALRAARDRHIAQLAATGHSNLAIARIVSLHPSSVSRCLRAYLDRFADRASGGPLPAVPTELFPLSTKGRAAAVALRLTARRGPRSSSTRRNSIMARPAGRSSFTKRLPAHYIMIGLPAED